MWHIIRFLTVLGLLLTTEIHAAPLETAPAELRNLPREYRLDGFVEAVNQTTVSAQTQGQVEEVFYDVDDYVEKNTILVRLKDTEQRARVAQAEADAKSATARLKRTKDEADRVAGLHKTKNVSESEMDKATTDLANAQAELDSANARLEQAREQLAYTRIRAPYSGIVTKRHVELGEMASPGTPVMTGISLEQLRVIVDVPQSVIPLIEGATKDKLARIYLPDNRIVESRAITVFPYADLGSNTFKVRIDLPHQEQNPDSDSAAQALFPGMFVKTGFVVGHKQELTVPKSAVVHRSEVTGVYVITPGEHVHFRQIRLGQELPDADVVLAGLLEGEQVALDPIAAGVILKTQVPMRHDAEEHSHE